MSPRPFLLSLLPLVFAVLLVPDTASAGASTEAGSEATLGSSRARAAMRERAPVGSHIRRRVVGRSIVPLDKTYAELDAAELARVKAQYEDIPEGDEPPFPARGLLSLYEVLVKARGHLDVTGALAMNVEVDEKGKATAVSVLRSPHPEMTRLAAAALMIERYKPAVCNGQPCRMAFPFQIEFTSAEGASAKRNYWVR